MTKIYYILFIASVAFIIISIIIRFTGQHDSLITLCGIIIYGIASIFIINKGIQMYKRDDGDYDKLKLLKPVDPNLSETELAKQKEKSASIGDLSGVLKGEKCQSGPSMCAQGTTWDLTHSKCVPTCPINELWDIETNKCKTSATCGNICGNVCLQKSEVCKEPFSTIQTNQKEKDLINENDLLSHKVKPYEMTKQQFTKYANI